MNAVEYIKTRCRLCKSKDGCSECPLQNKEDGRCIAYVSEYAEKAVQIVEQWGKCHPGKTRQSEFLKMFPNAAIDGYDGVLNIRPCRVDDNIGCDVAGENCNDCRSKYWLAEVTEND